MIFNDLIGVVSSAVIGVNITKGAGGTYHNFYLDSEGKLHATGYNNYGQLGLGDTATRIIWTQTATGVVDCAAGIYHSLYLAADGTLYAVGDNSYGQLGLGDTAPRTSWTQTATGVALVVACNNHSMYPETIPADCWGLATPINARRGRRRQRTLL